MSDTPRAVLDSHALVGEGMCPACPDHPRLAVEMFRGESARCPQCLMMYRADRFGYYEVDLGSAIEVAR